MSALPARLSLVTPGILATASVVWRPRSETMKCKNCGTEIADKALICYRCGQATFEAQRKPAALTPAGRRPGSLIVTLALTVLLLAALFLGQVTTDGVPEIVRWTIGALAAIILVWRIVTGRTTGRRNRPPRR